MAVLQDFWHEGGDGGRRGEVGGVDFCAAAEGFDERFCCGVAFVALWGG
jgi:hypothetical protein